MVQIKQNESKINYFRQKQHIYIYIYTEWVIYMFLNANLQKQSGPFCL